MPRYEKKFLLRDNQDLIIECMLDKSLSLDPNCSNLKCYTVHSLYFDDYLDSAFHDVEAGILKKIKFRIRSNFIIFYSYLWRNFSIPNISFTLTNYIN